MKPTLCLAAALLMAASQGRAQYTFFTPEGSFSIEVSLDNSPHLRLPIYRNAITSLAVAGDYAIGGTSANAGMSPFVFAASLSRGRLEMVFPLEKLLAGQRSIRSGFGRGPDGSLYAGTIPDRQSDDGHIIAIRVQANRLQVTDLGAPVPGEGVFSLTADPGTGIIYGISHPSGRFFVFDPNSQASEIYEETSPRRRLQSLFRRYALTPADCLSRRLIVDRMGRVYGSQPANKIFRFDPRSKKMELLGDLPEVWGRRSLGRADAWAMAPDGTLYGGNAGDGQLFKIDPATGKVSNLGKPIMMPRLMGLAFGRDGILYGVAGGAPGYSHLFAYSASGGGFVDLGNPRFPMVEPGIEQGIPWRGFQIGTLTASEDGRYIVMGEEEALSQLMVFPVK
jgi:hypothetical protein